MRPVLFAVFFLAAGFVVYLIASRGVFPQIESLVSSMGPAGPVFAVLAYILSTVLLVPGSALTLAAAALFGFKTGFMVVLVGANLGSLCAFLTARTFLREPVAQWASTKPHFRSIDRAIHRRGFSTVLLARLSPVLPFNALNYFLGITSVELQAYALATLIGILPGMILYVYVGAAARDVLTAGLAPAIDSYQQLLKYAGVVATALLVVMITRRARKELNQAESESSEPLEDLTDSRKDFSLRSK